MHRYLFKFNYYVLCHLCLCEILTPFHFSLVAWRSGTVPYYTLPLREGTFFNTYHSMLMGLLSHMASYLYLFIIMYYEAG